MTTEPSTLALISLIIAGLAVFFGPLVQLIIAKAQIRSTVLSATRQRWIDQLRELISEIITGVPELLAHAELSTIDTAAGIEKSVRIQFCRSKLALMLNPLEADHVRLLYLVDRAIDMMSKPEPPNPFLFDEITKVSQKILKQEWTHVKANN
jgi:hypothetical protein